jgi:uncharacterized protein YgiM (DUF1202 family)
MPPVQNIYIISTIVTTGAKPEDEASVYARVNALHTALAEELSGTSTQVASAPVTVPASVSPEVKRWRVTVASANLRLGPGVTFGIITQVKQGEVLTQFGARSGWVSADRGWINSTLLEAA